MRSITVIKIPPPLPKRKNAVAGGTNPSFASVTVIGRSKANAESPKQVASVNGMQNLHTHKLLYMCLVFALLAYMWRMMTLTFVTMIGRSKANAESPKQVARVNGMQDLCTCRCCQNPDS